MGLFDSLFKPNIEKMKAKKDVDGLIKALQHQDAELRLAAVAALEAIGDAGAAKSLIEAFKDDNGDVRERAGMAVKKMGKLAVEPLINALQDTNDDLRYRAVLALGEIGDVQAGPALINLLKDVQERIRKIAVETLGKIGCSGAVEPLIGHPRRKLS
jgi:HEAT repeat protein